MSFAAFVTVALVHLIAAISPGPTFVLTLRTALASGFAPAAGLAIGFGIGAALWAAAALLGLALVFAAAPIVLTGLKIAGGLYLVWLAVQLWRAAPSPMPRIEAAAAPVRTGRSVRAGLLAFLANPKPAVFFGAVFVGFVPVSATLADKALVIFNIFWVEIAWYVIVAAIFSWPRARAAYGRLKTRLDRGFAVILGALGARIALS